LPQAVKNILPALGNEFIALLKETSVVGSIPLIDLTKAGDIVRSRTYEAFFPLYSVAVCYLILVLGLGALQKKLERRLSYSDRN
jgi:ABC-type amino acid transport system permease subunit